MLRDASEIPYSFFIHVRGGKSCRGLVVLCKWITRIDGFVVGGLL